MILDTLKRLISEQFDVDEEEITAETSFADDLDADSIDLVDFIMAVEEEFSLPEIEETELEGIKTVGDVANFVAEKLK
ncbi:MAG: acyl carrier protein [Clostridia bacterium]|nr:acyl carrier protein [Clostridia bacterium]